MSCLSFGGQDQEREEFDGANDALRRFQTAAGRISAALNPLTFLLINLGIIVVLTAGGRQVYAGILTQGQITALVNYMTQILLSFIRISELVIAISRGLAGARRIKGVLETDTSMPDPAVLGSAGGQTGTGFAAAPVDASAEPAADVSAAAPADVNAVPAAEVSAVPAADVNAAAPAVELDHVSFTYSGASEPALKDIDLAAAPGETIGIIGSTGSGKTTLADLICRFYDAGEGEIRVFGRAIDSYGLKELPRVCGIVPQHNVLFAGTVRDNMRTVDPEADDSRIWQALGTAQASDFIGELPEGLDAQVETGGRNFSGGQRQRLAIARAITAHPPVLVLDDCSSALDYATDAALRAALKKDLAQTTVFIISQRAATVRDADRILVLDDGRVENIGAHEDLLEKSPVYREICSSQGLIPKEEGVGA